MNLTDTIKTPTWLFEFGIAIRRFDVADSPTGRFTDLTWSLGDRYKLPSLNSLNRKSEPYPLKAAWHERGLFFETTVDDSVESLPPGDARDRFAVTVYCNTRYAPGIHRANSYCCGLFFPFKRPLAVGDVSHASIHIQKLLRAKEFSLCKATVENSPAEVKRISENRLLVRVFIGEKGLPNYSPIEFPEISINFLVHVRPHSFIPYAHAYGMPVQEDPTLWCKTRLID